MEALQQVKADLIELLPRLQRYAGNLCNTSTDADELVQMTCLRVLEKHQQYTSGTSFDRWAFTIMSSVRSNYLRSQKHTEDLSDTERELQVKDTNESDTYLAQVLSLIHKLAVTQRQVMLLVYIEGFSYQETADILEIPIGTVMSRIARSRVSLAESLQTDKPINRL